MLKLLLVLIVLNGEVHTFAVQPESPAQCIRLEETAATWLPQLVGAKPEAFAVKCADLVPLLTAT